MLVPAARLVAEVVVVVYLHDAAFFIGASLAVWASGMGACIGGRVKFLDALERGIELFGGFPVAVSLGEALVEGQRVAGGVGGVV